MTYKSEIIDSTVHLVVSKPPDSYLGGPPRIQKCGPPSHILHIFLLLKRDVHKPQQITETSLSVRRKSMGHVVQEKKIEKVKILLGDPFFRILGGPPKYESDTLEKTTCVFEDLRKVFYD